MAGFSAYNLAMHTHHHRPHINLRLERWHRHSIYASLLLLLSSGSVWLIVRYFMRPVSQFGASIHPLEPWAMRFHGGAAMLVLFFLGSLMNAHIRRAIKAGRNLASGLSLLAMLAILIISGFGLYYLADEFSRNLWSLTHWIVGLAAAAAFILHLLIGQRYRS